MVNTGMLKQYFPKYFLIVTSVNNRGMVVTLVVTLPVPKVLRM